MYSQFSLIGLCTINYVILCSVCPKLFSLYYLMNKDIYIYINHILYISHWLQHPINVSVCVIRLYVFGI